MRKLKKLEQVVSVTIVAPFATDYGWQFGGFSGCDQDDTNGAIHLHEIYTKAAPNYTGRATVPVLWDKQRSTIVNNESSEIIRMLNQAFTGYGDDTIDLYPSELAAEIDALNERVYEQLNNGVYRAGFAVTQGAYEEAVTNVFAMLDELEQRVSDGRCYLFGDRITEADVRLFVTLVRFDPAYHGLFKCNLRRLVDYPNLSAYVNRMMDLPGARDRKCRAYQSRLLFHQGVKPQRHRTVGPDRDLWASSSGVGCLGPVPTRLFRKIPRLIDDLRLCPRPFYLIDPSCSWSPSCRCGGYGSDLRS